MAEKAFKRMRVKSSKTKEKGLPEFPATPSLN